MPLKNVKEGEDVCRRDSKGTEEEKSTIVTFLGKSYRGGNESWFVRDPGFIHVVPEKLLRFLMLDNKFSGLSLISVHIGKTF